MLPQHAAPATLPWIAVSPADMAMRADTAHLFRQVGVDPASLLFRDDIPLRALHDAGRLQLVLMDHNRLPGEWEDMGEVRRAAGCRLLLACAGK